MLPFFGSLVRPPSFLSPGSTQGYPNASDREFHSDSSFVGSWGFFFLSFSFLTIDTLCLSGLGIVIRSDVT